MLIASLLLVANIGLAHTVPPPQTVTATWEGPYYWDDPSTPATSPYTRSTIRPPATSP